jgi:hypothetical protein
MLPMIAALLVGLLIAFGFQLLLTICRFGKDMLEVTRISSNFFKYLI